MLESKDHWCPESEVRNVAPQNATNFGIGTLVWFGFRSSLDELAAETEENFRTTTLANIGF
jgi:hypothetical protein